ncbi:hypothetical protein [Glycomyces sp. NPDC047010]|uniref:hypothetical protein n=1 Tax=Glycomyces sp. NPDC047010 TaxID=3155023 RepID=UPI0033D7A619
MVDDDGIQFDQIAEDAAVLRTYKRVFAVLALESGKMVHSPGSIDVDEAIFEAFANADSDGLTEAQILARCQPAPESAVRSRLAILQGYGAVVKVFERRMERYWRATFPPYIMLLFLRRLAEQGGIAELHRMLEASRQQIENPDTTIEEASAQIRAVTYSLRLVANELGGLATGADIAQLRKNAQLHWGNEQLIDKARRFCDIAPERFPELRKQVLGLRSALAAFIDATEAVAGRMLDRASTTQGLGFLPIEAWDTFVKRSSVADLAAPLRGFVFDAPAVWFEAGNLIDAVEAAAAVVEERKPPPRAEAAEPVSPDTGRIDHDLDALTAVIEEILAGRDEVSVPELLRSYGDWIAARRVLSDLTAAHHHPDLPYTLEWSDTLRIEPAAAPAWTTSGTFRRADPEEAS